LSLKCEVAGEQRSAPAERHSSAAVSVVVHDRFGVPNLGAENETAGAEGTQSDRRARHAIERDLDRRESAHRFREREPRNTKHTGAGGRAAHPEKARAFQTLFLTAARGTEVSAVRIR
jgi:hypothetical protein